MFKQSNTNAYSKHPHVFVMCAVVVVDVVVVIKIIMKVFYPHVYSSTIYFCVGFLQPKKKKKILEMLFNEEFKIQNDLKKVFKAK